MSGVVIAGSIPGGLLIAISDIQSYADFASSVNDMRDHAMMLLPVDIWLQETQLRWTHRTIRVDDSMASSA